MKLRLARIVLAAIAAELLGVVALIVLVGIFGPGGGFKQAQPIL